jgi:hypothetical protein
MHLYSREGVSTTFAGDGGLGTGFTISNATRGDIPIDPTEYDPSTIFYSRVQLPLQIRHQPSALRDSMSLLIIMAILTMV